MYLYLWKREIEINILFKVYIPLSKRKIETNVLTEIDARKGQCYRRRKLRQLAILRIGSNIQKERFIISNESVEQKKKIIILFLLQ